MTIDLDHGNALEVRPKELGIRFDVELDDLRDGQAASGAVLECPLDCVTRFLAQVAARARVEAELGEGSGHAPMLLRTAFALGGRGFVGYDPITRPRSSVDRARPS
jgi:hypothetical protein